MSLFDTFGGAGGGGSSSGIFGAGNPGAPSGFGQGPNSKTGAAPGFTSPFDQSLVGGAANLGGEAMANRYAQLGLSGVGATPTSPGGLPGGVGVGGGANWASAGGANPGMPGSDMPTAEAMDLGMLPTLTGGIPGEAEATLGMIQNANLANTGGGGGSGGGKGGGAGGAASALGGLGKAAAGGK